MIRMKKPSSSVLRPVAREARGDRSPEQWARDYLSALVEKVLRRDPLQYRAFGPFWWPLKQLVMETLDTDEFGDRLDAEWIEAAGYGDPILTITAAHLYHEAKFDSGAIYDPHHILEDEDGDGIEFVSDDSDMEMLAAAVKL